MNVSLAINYVEGNHAGEVLRRLILRQISETLEIIEKILKAKVGY